MRTPCRERKGKADGKEKQEKIEGKRADIKMGDTCTPRHKHVCICIYSQEPIRERKE